MHAKAKITRTTQSKDQSLASTRLRKGRGLYGCGWGRATARNRNGSRRPLECTRNGVYNRFSDHEMSLRDECLDYSSAGCWFFELRNTFIRTKIFFMHYFAYGSNMDANQMSKRCPDAVMVATGMATGFRFRINTNGVATIVPDEMSSVHGIMCISRSLTCNLSTGTKV